MTTPKKYDVVVIGAGPVGAALALNLSQKGLGVAIVEKCSRHDLLTDTHDIRAYALSHATIEYLKGLNVWAALEPSSEPIQKIAIASGESPNEVVFKPPAVHSAMGAIIPAYRVRHVFLTKIIEDSAIDLYDDVNISNLDNPLEGFAKVSLSSGQVLESLLIVGADGRSSVVRDLVGLRPVNHDYNQKSLITVVEHTESHQGIAYEKFYASGPFATLPMLNNQSGIVWIGDSAEIDSIYSLEENLFKGLLQDRYNSVGEITHVSERVTYPLQLTFLNHLYYNRVVVVGDAAHAIHPLAGQSLNLGFRDVMMLSEAIVSSNQVGIDIGQGTVLDQYQRSRRFDTLELITTTHGLNSLFSNSNSLLKTIRKLGLSVFAKVPGAASYATRHAMGLSGYQGQ
jgi:2-octaprenyl-6-methoxyphenol hydroxylase